jgi:hypothetical protein
MSEMDLLDGLSFGERRQVLAGARARRFAPRWTGS